MPNPPRLPALYAILDFDLTHARGLRPPELLDAWLDAGIRLIQFRAKHLTFGPFVEMAERLAEPCRRAGAIFIVNDRVDVAQLVGADGVHVGQDDLSPANVRTMLPHAPWVGLSTHTHAQVQDGLASAATYLAIGPVFSTQTKVNPWPAVGLEGVARVALLIGREKPLVAIGGITADTAASVLAAGASAVAVIAALLDGADPERAAQALVRAVT